jgi:hypothetical protein
MRNPLKLTTMLSPKSSKANEWSSSRDAYHFPEVHQAHLMF